MSTIGPVNTDEGINLDRIRHLADTKYAGAAPPTEDEARFLRATFGELHPARKAKSA